MQFDDDAALIHSVVTGDPAAIEHFFKRFQPRFLMIARRAGLRFEDAEDVAPSALVDVLRQHPNIRGDCKLGSWLERILRGTIVNKWRSLPPVTPLGEKMYLELDGNEPPASHIALSTPPVQELTFQVRAVLRAMPPVLAALLKLNILEGFSAREIAERLGWPPKVASRKIMKAKEVFREILEGRGKSADRTRQIESGDE